MLTWTESSYRFSEDGICHVWRSEKVSYGVKDAKGRDVGGYVTIENGSAWREPGFYVRTNATRDGKGFGAIAKSARCATLEEAKALGEKKIADAAKRYAKLAAKGVGRQWRAA